MSPTKVMQAPNRIDSREVARGLHLAEMQGYVAHWREQANAKATDKRRWLVTLPGEVPDVIVLGPAQAWAFLLGMTVVMEAAS